MASGLPQDWSNRHLIYSNPETHDEAIRNGTLAKWSKKADDPRYVVALEQKEQATAVASGNASSGRPAGVSASAAGDVAEADSPSGVGSQQRRRPPVATGAQIHRDWSNVMGGASGVGGTRTYPAKFAFGISTKDCTSDFVAFTTSTAGATSAGGARATQDGIFTGQPAAGQTVTITNPGYSPAQVLTLTASTTSNVGLNFLIGAASTDTAANLANAIARNGGVVGVTATNPGAPSNTVTATATTIGTTQNFIALADTLTGFAWTEDKLLGGTNGTAIGQPTIFALNQLYADTVANGGCQTATQAVPAVYWSYNTGTGAVADLSPALSFYDNGAQVAFMQRSNANVSSLVLLKWSSSSPGTLGAPTTPASVTAANYLKCAAPCMVALPFANGQDDTMSAPFVDYVNDVIYVGDDTGNLHKFTGVFTGRPQEAASPWPVTVSSGNVLSSPVYDTGSQLVFVGSNCAANTTNCNRLHSVNTSGTVVNSGAIGSTSTVAITGGNGVRDAPIVDTTAQRVYAFIGADNSTNGSADSLGNTCTTAPCAAVFQFATNTSLATQNSGLGAKVVVGMSGSNNSASLAIQSGAFDDTYYSSATPLSPSGNLYVCGSQRGAARNFTLWKLTIASNSFSARTLGPQLSTDTGAALADPCSPVTVFKNGSTEYLYASVINSGTAAGGAGCTSPATGCVYMYTLAAPSFGTVFDTTSASSTINSATARYIDVSTSVALNTTETVVDTALTAAKAGSYSGMTITQSAASPAGDTFTYTLRNNATSTAIACQVTAGNSTCSDTAHTAGYAVGDLIDVQVARTAGTTNLTATFRVQLTADVTWNSGGSATAALHASGGTGGIIVDNTVSGGGAQVYFATRTIPGIAVQATQAGLN